MNARRDGFALLTVLWLVVLISMLISTHVVPVVVAQTATINRTLQTRARWAALACLELARARFVAGGEEATRDSIALGDIVWCQLASLSTDERVNPNMTDSAGLQRLIGDESAVASLLDWIDGDEMPRAAGAESDWYASRGRYLPRNAPIMDAAELRLVRGFEDVAAADLEAWFTARGTGRLSANRASGWALASVATLSTEDIDEILRHRRGPRTYAAPDQLAAITGIEFTIPEFAELTTRLSFDDSERTVRIRGSANAGGRVLESTFVVTFAETDTELVVRRLEVR